MSLETLIKVAEVLDVSPDFLLGIKMEPNLFGCLNKDEIRLIEELRSMSSSVDKRKELIDDLLSLIDMIRRHRN